MNLIIRKKTHCEMQNLNSLGFTVMRFNNDEVMREIEAVVEQIYLFLENVRAD